MWIAEIWRYPVKSMAGERLDRTELREDGILGDRILHVRNPRGRVVTSRHRPALLGHRGSLGPDGEPLVDGRPWGSPEVLADVRRAARDEGAQLVRHDGLDRFDVLPLLVATDGAIRTLGYDLRRFRPNVVIGGVEGLDERGWPSRRLRLGRTRIEVRELRQRCVMTTFDPDTLEQDVEVLLRIRRELDGTFALDCSVLEGGNIAVGEPVQLLEP
ncbi:MAG: MOSC N-terminal beta barrel domain-containing protein [Planctomycetes bacterium]|nr:MOSC N-terminal beta barrel domain-containing protein [Planctomycetota bacterium]